MFHVHYSHGTKQLLHGEPEARNPRTTKSQHQLDTLTGSSDC